MARFTSRLSAIFVCGSLLGSTFPAQAEETRSQAIAAAQRVYREAHEAMDRGDWLNARRLLLDLWQKSETYDVAASLGEAEYALGNYPDAARYLQFAIAEAPPKEKKSLIDDYQRALTEVEKRVAKLRVRAEPEGAEVVLDGRELGPAPLRAPVYVNPGHHEFSLRTERGVVNKAIETTAGNTYEIRLAALPDAPDSSSVTAANDGRASTRAELSSSAAVVPPTDDFAPRSSAARYAPWVSGGIALVGFGVGVGFLVSSAHQREDMRNVLDRFPEAQPCAANTPHVTECARVKELDRDARSHQLVGLVSIGVGAAAAVTTAVLILSKSGRRHEASTRSSTLVVPVWQPGRAVLNVQGQF